MRSTRPWRSARASALAIGLVALATSAGGDPAGAPLAAPGPCAEARPQLGAAPDDQALEPPLAGEEGADERAGEKGADGFDVAGSPRHHFTPGDVAAGGGDGAPSLPQAPSFTRDPCDAPLAGCSSILERGRGEIDIDEPPVGTDPSPGGRETRGD